MCKPVMARLPACVALLLLMVCRLAAANPTYTVNSTDDLVDDNVSDGLCHTSAGSCTLRAAVMQSNANAADAPVILLPAGHYLLTRAPTGSGDDSGSLDLKPPLPASAAVTSIRGAGATSTIIDGNHLDRVFKIGAGRFVELHGVTLTNGQVMGSSGGGGLQNDGNLRMSNSVVTQNYAQFFGGGIFNDGKLLLDRVEVSACVALTAGGIATTDDMTMTNSTIGGNTAYGQIGGGIMASGGNLVLVNDTIVGNATIDSGGGIYVDTVVSASIYNTTIAFNLADSDGDGNGRGAGLYLTHPADIYNSIVAGNTPPTGPLWDDCFGQLTTHADNLLGGTPSCQKTDCTPTGIEGCTITQASGHHDLLNQVSLLGTLGHHGGATQTVELLPGSNAIDYGGTTCEGAGSLVTTDQRGYPRPVDAHCDMGAYEYQGADFIFANGFD